MANTKVKAEQLEAAQTNITSLGTLTGLTGGTGDLIWDTPTFVVDSSANKVGIGTASPAAALHIEVADNTEFLKATITGNESWAFKGASGSGVTDYVSFGISGGTQAMAWQEDGMVGIGTTSPDVNSFGTGHGVLTVQSATGSAKTAMLNLSGDGNDTDATRVASLFFNDASATGAGKSLAGVEAYRASNHATDPGGDLLFSTNVSGGSYTERMRIQADGNVGIGINAPSTSLDIVRAGVQPLRLQSTSGTEVAINMVNTGGNVQLEAHSGNFTIDAAKVSIASTSTAAQLNVYESSNSQMQFQTSATGTGSSNGARFGYNGSGAQIWNFQNNYVRFATNNVERVRINNLGYLGIATNDPLYPLDSTGSGEIQGRFKSTGDTGYTQGAIVIESSDSTSSPGDRGQGVYMFNHGTDKTWYMGTTYADAGTFQIGVVGGSTLQKSAASHGSSQGALRINAGRQVMMGTAAHNDDVLYLTRGNAGKLLRLYQGGSEVGYIGTTSGTTSLPSDRDFKKDINDLNLGLDFVKSLNPKTFRLKIEENDSPLSTGLIAQEIEESLTQAGITKNSLAFIQHKPNEDAEQSQYWINNESLIPVLINAIQELSAKLEAK